ncbi:hypothetical protein [Streptomyces sp. H39-S7]|uniref:hypothetical protein n=1 Tax=Streptomyces sp. H39-S7 TaxID=3004357 RepID=UPI0022B01B61|nr:hypothetical protein [Streptomyces sp. H39-S7]MCZ4122710.1 hypothetical protein [Streptomyces sp. H39-S7]
MPHPHAHPDLVRFAAQIAARLPGAWAATAHRPSPGPAWADPFHEVWDDQTLEWATSEYRPHRAAVMTRGSDRLLVTTHPQRGAEFIVGALAPAGLGEDSVGDANAPRAIVVGADPVRAATDIARRFLPRYDQAVWPVRIRALAAAADGIQRATARWDAISDSFCNQDGWPIDETGYANGKVARDAAAWEHVETFLAHGPAVLASVQDAATAADYLDGPISNDLRRLREIGTHLEGAAQLQRDWQETTAQLTASLPWVQEIYQNREREFRNAEGWNHADELGGSGPALVRAAQHLTGRTDSKPSESEQRMRAALARSAPALHNAPLSAPAPAGPSSSGAIRRSR